VAVVEAKTGQEPTVHVVDDDPQVRESLGLLVRTSGMRAKTYGSAEEFINELEGFPDTPACLVLDVRLPGLSGLGLQRELNRRGVQIPIIMISGYADVPTVVQAMSAGALDFMEKPLSGQVLMRRIVEALDRSVQQRVERARHNDVASRIATLSPREREVMEMLVAGKHAKQIAAEFGIGDKTVLKHRAKVLEKMRVDNVAELVRLLLAHQGATNGR